VIRERTATYFAGKGTIKTLTNLVSGGKVPGSGTPGTLYNNQASTFSFVYDNNGNLQSETDPSNYVLTYAYDAGMQIYRASVTDSFLYTSTSAPNYLFGTVASTADENGQKEKYVYDNFGRLSQVFGPDDQTATEPTIAMTYNAAVFPAVAVTKHKDVQRAGDPIETVTFIDGLRRVIQTKKDVDRDPLGNGTVQTGMSVSGLLGFDGRGRVISAGQPTFVQGGVDTNFIVTGAVNPTLSSYDILGRKVSVILPDGSTTTTEYLVSPNSPGSDPIAIPNGSTWLETRVTDALLNKRLGFADARANHVAVQEFNIIGTATTKTTLTTKYTYDPLDQLLTVTDTKGNVTTSVYDSVGQMVTLTNPDAGQVEYRYDLAGNLAEKQTPVLRAQSKVIKYNYDRSRLTGITYPNLTGVAYTYGASTETGDGNGNVAGRIKLVTTESGTEQRFYDHMGNVNKTLSTLKSMASGLPATITFTMKYSFDWMSRMLSMTFPNWIDQSYNFIAGEGELVSYSYDHGGNLNQITGHDQTPNPQQTSAPLSFTYLSHIGYDEFEQRTVFVSGNGIANNYTYDGRTRRLTDVSASTFGALEHQLNKPPTPFHRLHYTYDTVGNVTHLTNNVSVQPWRNAGVFVGPLDVSYTYDNLYQLRSLSGKYRPNVAYGYQYSDSYTYDEIGNVKTKAQSQDRLVWDNQTVNTGDPNPVVTQLAGSRFDHNVTALTYSLANNYTGTRPHAAATATETIPVNTNLTRTNSYDANGNNTGNTFQSNTKAQVWDEENRLKEVDKNGAMLAKFRYDDSGERRKKQTAAGDAWYVNQYFVLLPNNLPTKHIFAGETRIASKTDAIYMQTPALTYYHPDNLGSTSYTSAANQDLLQHERYFAFGELWRPGAEQEECDLGRPDNLRREWTFASKEWDVDTSLYYYGARYFDPHSDVWQSPDPLLKSYMRGEPNMGAFFPQNLGVYTYGWNNPVVMRDPDGKAINLVAALVGAAAGAVIGGAVYGAKTLITGEEFSGRAFAGSVAGGAVTGGLAGLTMGASLAVEATGAAVAGVAGGVTSRGIETGSAEAAFNPKAMATDAAVGLAGFGAGKAISAGAKAVSAARASASGATRSTARVLANKAAGDAFRDDIASRLEAEGLKVDKEVTKKTIFGDRRIDIEVSKDGKVLGGVETKVGKSRYHASQRAKDAWLKMTRGYIVNVVRDK
jgi:RHS repeat-associated protein